MHMIKDIYSIISFKYGRDNSFSQYLVMNDQENISMPELETENLPFNIKSLCLQTQVTMSVVGLFSLFVHHITHQYIRNSIRWMVTKNKRYKVLMNKHKNNNQNINFRNRPAGETTALTFASIFTSKLLESITFSILFPFIIR